LNPDRIPFRRQLGMRSLGEPSCDFGDGCHCLAS
jgi:hypothetical protein